MSDIKMNCRLWSDTQPLEPILQAIGMTPDICHVPGRPMGVHGSVAKRIAHRHYATILNEDGVDNADVARWLESAISSLDAHRILSDGIRAGTIEAVLWIAILALPASPDISIAPRFVDAVAALGATIFLEDYNKPDENGFFYKQWFP